VSNRSFEAQIEPITVAPRQARGRAGRWLAATTGVLLTVVGLALLLPAITVVILVIALAVSSGDVGSPGLEAVASLTAMTVGGLVLWAAGAKLLRGRPQTVLFLRKFGFDEAKDFVSHAAGEALGRRWRLVTLDDLSTQPVGTKRWKRWLVRIIMIVAVVVAVWLIYEAVQVLLNPDDDIIDNAVDSAVEDAENPVAGVFAAIVTAFAMALVVALVTVMAALIVSFLTAVVGAFGMVTFAANRALTRAERDEWTPARSRDELIAFLDRTEKQRSKLFAPRIAVVRVIDALWKEAVSGLADISDAVLIDISQPTESLLWELQMLARRPDIELVVIGAADEVRALKASGGFDRDDRASLAVLGPRPVLVYGDDRKAFARELRHMLDTTQHDRGR
jgi:hypothetical protein